MSYAHIQNLYRDQRIQLFRECYALEKVHGMSTSVSWCNGILSFFPGGLKPERFAELFDSEKLRAGFEAMGHAAITIYGEAYGAKILRQAYRYGKDLRFVTFDVKIGDPWLAVPQAHDVSDKMGLSFVHYEKVSTDLAALDAVRDAPSEEARRAGVEGDQPREGIVVRPLIELTDNAGHRIIAKHKRDEERETASPRKVVDPARLEVLVAADRIAVEWVTPMRLDHVLSKLGEDVGLDRTRDVIMAMTEDVVREAGGEIVDSREARSAIGRATALMFRGRLAPSDAPEGDA